MRLVVGVAAVLLIGAGGAGAKQVGDWSVGSGQGYVAYSVSNESGDEFAFSCDEGASVKGETKKTGLTITIKGEPPPAESSYTVTADGRGLDFYSNEKSDTDTLCKVCSQNFIDLWDRVRSANTLTVTLSDKRRATFRIAGAAKALPKRHCMTGYDSQ